MNAWDICLTHDPVYGGIYRSVCNFARALDARILSFDDGRSDRSLFVDERPTVRIPCRPRPVNRDCHLVTPGMAAEAGRMVAGADLLVVHSLFRGHAPWAARWARTHGARCWSAPHGCLDPWVMRRRPLAKRLWLARHGRDFFGTAATIFATSRERQKAAPLIGAGRSVVVHWPVPLPDRAGRDAMRAAFRAEHAIPESARVLLFAARLHPLKRPRETIEAFLRAGAAEAHLVVAGGEQGITLAQLRACVPEAGRSRVHLVGPLSAARLAAAFSGSDGFISLSHRENFGYSFGEALARGLPAIVSSGHDLAHEIGPAGGDFPCGWLLPDDDPATAVAAIREWAQATPDRLTAMGAVGRAWAGEELSFERFRDRLLALASDA